MGNQPIGTNEQPNTVPAGTVGPLPVGEQKPATPSESREPLFSDEQQRVVGRLVSDAVDKQLKTARSEWEEEQDKANRKLMRETAREQGQYQKLADEQRDELEGYTDDKGKRHEGLRDEVARLRKELANLSGNLEADYQTTVATLPAFLKRFMPADTEPLSKRREWLADAILSAQESGVLLNTNQVIPGLGPSPTPGTPPNQQPVNERVHQQKVGQVFGKAQEF